MLIIYYVMLLFFMSKRYVLYKYVVKEFHANKEYVLLFLL